MTNKPITPETGKEPGAPASGITSQSAALAAEVEPSEVTPQMLRAGQMTEAGGYVCANLSGGYELLTKLYQAMHSAAPTAPTAPAEPSRDAEEATAAIMAQAQVFASAWSLVGGRFDTGTALDDANDAKAELRTMVLALASFTAAAPQAEPQPLTKPASEPTWKLMGAESPEQWEAFERWSDERAQAKTGIGTAPKGDA